MLIKLHCRKQRIAWLKEFKSDFKVYDFGFYLHDESYSGGYPEAFAQAIADVSAKSPYYLLFGKQTDHSGGYTKFWVDLKLPTTGELSCLPEVRLSFIGHEVEGEAEKEYDLLNRQTKECYIAEIKAMKWLQGYIDNKISCCGNVEDGL